MKKYKYELLILRRSEMKKYKYELLKSWLGFDDWIVSKYETDKEGNMICFYLGRWHGHEFLEFKFEGKIVL